MGERTLSSKLTNLALSLALSMVAVGTAQAQDKSQESPELQKASSLHLQGKLKEAEVLYREILRKEPDNAVVHTRLGACLAALSIDKNGKNQKDMEETAILEERQAIKLNPKDHMPHIQLGKIYANSGKLEEAIKEFNQAIALKPDSYMAHIDLGTYYMHLDKAEDAIRVYKKANELKPEKPTPYINLGVAYQSIGRFDEAVAIMKKALELKLNKNEQNLANFNLGNIYADKGEADNAIASYEAALKAEPSNLLATSGIGWMKGSQGQYDEDIALQKKVLKLCNGQRIIESVARARMASALAAKGDTKTAEVEFEKCAAMKPPFPVALVDYGHYLEKKGRKNEAKSQFQKALQVQPSFKPAQDALAKLEGNTQTK